MILSEQTPELLSSGHTRSLPAEFPNKTVGPKEQSSPEVALQDAVQTFLQNTLQTTGETSLQALRDELLRQILVITKNSSPLADSSQGLEKLLEALAKKGILCDKTLHDPALIFKALTEPIDSSLIETIGKLLSSQTKNIENNVTRPLLDAVKVDLSPLETRIREVLYAPDESSVDTLIRTLKSVGENNCYQPLTQFALHLHTTLTALTPGCSFEEHLFPVLTQALHTMEKDFGLPTMERRVNGAPMPQLSREVITALKSIEAQIRTILDTHEIVSEKEASNKIFPHLAAKLINPILTQLSAIEHHNSDEEGVLSPFVAFARNSLERASEQALPKNELRRILEDVAIRAHEITEGGLTLKDLNNETLQALHDLITKSDALNHLSNSLLIKGNTAPYVIPFILHGMLTKMEARLYPNRTEYADDSNKDSHTNLQKQFTRIALSFPLRSLGLVSLDLAYRPSEALLNIQLETNRAHQFIQPYLPRLRAIFTAMGYVKSEIRSGVAKKHSLAYERLSTES